MIATERQAIELLLSTGNLGKINNKNTLDLLNRIREVSGGFYCAGCQLTKTLYQKRVIIETAMAEKTQLKAFGEDEYGRKLDRCLTDTLVKAGEYNNNMTCSDFVN